jgi:hypothetical protein
MTKKIDDKEKNGGSTSEQAGVWSNGMILASGHFFCHFSF